MKLNIPCIRPLLCGALAALAASPLGAVITDLVPLQKGTVVGTCFSSSSPFNYVQDPNGFVVALIDASATELAGAPTDVPGGSHNWKRFHNEQAFQNPGAPDPNQEWAARNLGEVFGITLDDAPNPNVYVTATTTYGVHPTPAGNSHGTVYKLDGTTGDITPFNCIQAGTASLGNITHWRADNGSGHLYVSNLDDGLIYLLDMSGNCVGTYDHGVTGRPNASPPLPPLADDSTQNFSQLGRRVYGLKAFQGRLYYGVWNAANAHAVWSVRLDGFGAPIPATATLELPGIAAYNPVSDLDFSQDGRMFLAHRYHRAVPYGGPHQDGIREYVLVGPVWTPSAIDKFKVGNYSSGRNSAGGVDVECTGAVWASGDALNFPVPPIYGITRIPAGGNQADSPHGANSHFIDLDGDITNNLKTYIGDVEIYDPCDDCFDITDIKVECPLNAGDPYDVTFTLTNRSTQVVHYLWHNPCPAGDLPAGAITGQPSATGPQPLPTPLAPGDSTTVTVSLPAPLSGGTFCWNITLLDETGGECCTDKVCIDLPDCDCFIVIDKSIECTVDADGTIKYTLNVKLQNTSGFDWHHVNLLPPAAFAPASFDLSGSPVPNGSSYTLTTCVSGNPGDALCFNIAVHSEDIELCCSKECCIILPPCDGGKPDGCSVTRLVPCCPEFPGGPSTATAVLTICNNSPVARTYSWNMNALPPGPGCDSVLALGASAFSPSAGTVTVGPNSCVSISVRVDCEGVQPGRRACYEACVRQVDDPSNRFCCDGRIYVPGPNDPVIKIDPNGDPSGVDVLAPGGVTRRNLAVMNPSAEALRYVFEIRSLGDFIEISSDTATSPGFEAVKRIEVNLAPFATEIVALELRASQPLPFENIMVPIFAYSLGGGGEVGDTIFSFLAIAGTVEASAPVLKGLARNPDGTFAMELATTPGRTYRIESSETLGSGNVWAPVTCSTVEIGGGQTGTEFVATNSSLLLVITPDPTCPKNFFRAVALP